MGWEGQLDDCLRTSRRVKWFFLFIGLIILGLGILNTYFRLEELCVENFGNLCTLTSLGFLYLVVPYASWALAFALLGFVAERKLNLESARWYIASLALIPLAYGLARFLLAEAVGLVATPLHLLGFAFITAVLLAVYLSGIILKWRLEKGAEAR